MKQVKHRERGAFTISLDFELVWGTLDIFGPDEFSNVYKYEREHVIDRLLELFVEFEIPATWCILGHLFLDKCSSQNGLKHPEIVRPRHSWHPADWFDHDPCSDSKSSPIFYGRDLVEKIQACRIPQEIGSHSFSHVIFGDKGCSPETAESELAECVKLAREMNLELRSFVFPRNEVGHLDLVREAGFECYRGVEPNWYENRKYPHSFRRMMRLIDVLRAAEPPVVLPEKQENGLWNVPGSAMYFPMNGFRRFIPLSLRTKRAIKGINAAVSEKKIFHLWFHPTNMADEPEKMFSGLREILEYAESLRTSNMLEILPMKAYAS
jgi:peptidoglycan/xylan/chitin deacetylase (PgdA/CDA1 family)